MRRDRHRHDDRETSVPARARCAHRLAAGPPALAETLAVDTLADNASLLACDAATPNDCSLRGATIKARGLTGPTTIDVPAGTYTLTQLVVCPWRATTAFTSPLNLTMLGLCLRGDTTLVGAGAGVTVIDANQPAGANGTIANVAYVDAFATVEIRGNTMKRGNFSYGDSTGGTGGDIRNAGKFLLVDSVVSDSKVGDMRTIVDGDATPRIEGSRPLPNPFLSTS